MTNIELAEQLQILRASITELGHQRLKSMEDHQIFIIHSEIEPIAYLEKAFDKAIKDLK